MENPSDPIIALSRSVVLTEQSSIPSFLLLGKLVSDVSPAASLPDKLRQIWGPSGTVNFWRVTADGTFLIQFNEVEDLRKAHDGAPWPCGGGHDLFLMEHVKPGMNMVDQIAGLTKADLWVRFHGVPVDHFSTNTVSDLAKAIGETVNGDLSHTSSLEFLRARVRVDITQPLKRSLNVKLENDDEQATSRSVSVKYEVVPSLCSSCGILGHPVGRCPGRANQPAAAPGSSHLMGSHEVAFATAPGQQGPLSPVNKSRVNWLLTVTRLIKWRNRSVGKNKSFYTGDDSQDKLLAAPSNHENSAQECGQVMHSHFIVQAHGSRSRKHSRIVVEVETHCSPQLIKGAMEWLKVETTGLDAVYDGKKGVISIFGLKIDQNTDPVDLIAHVIPTIRQKTGFAETQISPDSPERFKDTIVHFHDANCCKDASKK